MVSLPDALLIVVGTLLLGSFILVPVTNPPDTYTVTVASDHSAVESIQYGDLSADYKQVFDVARTNDGTKQYTGHTYPDGVEFPSENGVSSRYVTYENTTYLMQFIHVITQPDTIGIIRMVGSLIGGVTLLSYSGYRNVAV